MCGNVERYSTRRGDTTILGFPGNEWGKFCGTRETCMPNTWSHRHSDALWELRNSFATVYMVFDSV